jgi:Fe-S cluster assembly protein SufB
MAEYVPNRGYAYGFSDPEAYLARTPRGITEDTVRAISAYKQEPDWMLDIRLAAYAHFCSRKIPTWGPDLSTLNFDEMTYYLRAADRPQRSWDDVPDAIKETFEKIGVPEAERKFLAGAGAQYDSESVYHNLRVEWEDRGVIFTDMDTGLREYPDIIREHFGSIIPYQDNMFAALNTAVWSGGSFVYIPRGVVLDTPLQAYFRINAKNAGQFERTLIIVEDGASVHYVEGCSAPVYTSDSLHAAVVEVIVKQSARARYTTVQNWSGDVYNLVTKRAHVATDGIMEWVDCNLGSKITMKYPSIYLKGARAHGEVLSLAVAGKGQNQDTGTKIFHLAPGTTSRVTAKSISFDGGTSSYRGIISASPNSTGCISKVACDALILDEHSISNTFPTIASQQPNLLLEHEATVSKVSEEQLVYLQSRGISADAALGMLVNGFVEPIVKELPMEFALEMNRLIALNMEGSVG